MADQQIAEQLAADVQAVFNLERVIQVGVVDQTFPADGGTRLFEVDAHDQIEGVADFCSELLEARGVVLGSLDIVDRAGADDDEQAVVLAIENVTNNLAAFDDGRLGSFTERNLGF